MSQPEPLCVCVTTAPTPSARTLPTTRHSWQTSRGSKEPPPPVSDPPSNTISNEQNATHPGAGQPPLARPQSIMSSTGANIPSPTRRPDTPHSMAGARLPTPPQQHLSSTHLGAGQPPLARQQSAMSRDRKDDGQTPYG